MKQLGEVITIIPAKGLSARLKRKNIALLAGKPLLAYTIEKAKKSGVCGTIMVSTEDKEIACIAKDHGAVVPFMRPKFLSRDPYEVPDVCLNVLDEYEKQGQKFDTLIILLPTSPLCSINDILTSINLFKEEKANFLMSVSRMDPHYYHAMILDELTMKMTSVFQSQECNDQPIPVRANGAVTIVDVPAFKKAGTYYGKPLIGYEMPWERSVDVDTLKDLAFAEWLIENKENRKIE